MDFKLSRNTRALGITSFLVDVSSEMLTPIMPLFLVNVLKANALIVGLMEGISEIIVAVLRMLSGYISDRFGERKRFIVIGYFISSIMKIFFTLASTWQQVIGIRAAERFGKGIRGVPRDAIINYSEKRENLGRAFGYRKMMDAVGAIVGPIIAAILVTYLIPQLGEEGTYRSIFLIAVIPAVAGVIIAVKFVENVNDKASKDGNEIIADIWKHNGYRSVLAVGVFFAIAQFGTAFFILKAQEITHNALITIFGYMVYNISYAVFAFPVGILTDKLGGKKITALAYALFAIIVISFAFANDLIFILFFVLLGLVMSILETAPRTFIAKTMGHKKYGTAIGFYQGVTGILLLPANLIAGLLWDVHVLEFRATFVFSFIVSMLAALLMLIAVRDLKD